MEDNKVEVPIMEEEKFEDFLKENMYNDNGSLKLYLHVYEGVGKFKSIRRAIKRGHVSMEGYIYPNRPFGNTKSYQNVLKRKIYAGIKARKRSAV